MAAVLETEVVHSLLLLLWVPVLAAVLVALEAVPAGSNLHQRFLVPKAMEVTSAPAVDRIYGDESLTSPRLIDANPLSPLLG